MARTWERISCSTSMNRVLLDADGEAGQRQRRSGVGERRPAVRKASTKACALCSTLSRNDDSFVAAAFAASSLSQSSGRTRMTLIPSTFLESRLVGSSSCWNTWLYGANAMVACQRSFSLQKLSESAKVSAVKVAAIAILIEGM